MSEGGYELRRRSGTQRDTIGLALIGLVIVLSLLIAAAIALPAWTSINTVPTATPTPEAVGMVGPGAGSVAGPGRSPNHGFRPAGGRSTGIDEGRCPIRDQSPCPLSPTVPGGRLASFDGDAHF